MAMPFDLFRLPPEIISEILRFLEPRDLIAVALTCRLLFYMVIGSKSLLKCALRWLPGSRSHLDTLTPLELFEVLRDRVKEQMVRAACREFCFDTGLIDHEKSVLSDFQFGQDGALAYLHNTRTQDVLALNNRGQLSKRYSAKMDEGVSEFRCIAQGHGIVAMLQEDFLAENEESCELYIACKIKSKSANNNCSCYISGL